jgi:hypothetical protein
MGKRQTKGESRAQALEVLQGGQPIPANIGRVLAKPSPDTSFAQETALQLQGARVRRRLGKSSPKPREPETPRALRELRAITDGVARRKPALLPLALQPGISWGSYTVVATPPYYSAQDVIVSPTGDPDLSSSADAETGELRCRAVTNNDDASSGGADAYMAIYFRPLFGPARVRIHADMDIDFAWWVNSLGPAAISRAQGLMRVYVDNTFEVAARAAFLGWSIYKENALDFNFGSYPAPSWSLSLEVSRKHYYLVVFSLSCFASGSGWPGSLAGSQVSMRIPSVTFDVEWIPVVAQL